MDRWIDFTHFIGTLLESKVACERLWFTVFSQVVLVIYKVLKYTNI